MTDKKSKNDIRSAIKSREVEEEARRKIEGLPLDLRHLSVHRLGHLLRNYDDTMTDVEAGEPTLEEIGMVVRVRYIREQIGGDGTRIMVGKVKDYANVDRVTVDNGVLILRSEEHPNVPVACYAQGAWDRAEYLGLL